MMEDLRAVRSPVANLALGFLLPGPAHTYELRERIRLGLGSVWRVATSQLYAVLHRLEAEGLVRSTPAEGRGASRLVYALTPCGERALWTWATSPVRSPRDLRLEFLAKVYFVRRFAPERLPGLLEEETCALTDLASRLARVRRVATDDPEVGRLTAAYRRAQVEAALRWLKAAREEMRKESG